MSCDELQPIIGLEIHCQLRTESRLFSPGPVDSGASPNSRLTAYDIALPGSLPVVNRRAVDMAIGAGLALDCTIHSRSRFDRKHYFYPDLPRGYQITQYDRPLCSGGELVFDVDGAQKSLALTGIHLEEDAGKSIHDDDHQRTLIDYNRAGTPLIEIVTDPDLRSPTEAEAALRALHRLVVHLGICDGNLEDGSFRCDANISLRGPDGQRGGRTELKNLNSFRFVRRALSAEIRRRRQQVSDPGSSGDETRLYDPDHDSTRPMRSKETSPDYRFVPDPDLPELTVDYDQIQRVRDELPESPRRRRRRFIDGLGLSVDNAERMVDPPARADFFERAVQSNAGAPAPSIANFIANDVLSYVTTDIGALDISPEDVADIVALVEDSTISTSAASTVLEELLDCDESPRQVVERLELRQLDNDDQIETIVDQVLRDNPQLVADYRQGKTKLFGHFMGQVMKASSGRADPEKASAKLRDKLSSPTTTETP